MLERHFTAERLNEIVNDPSIYPWICGLHTDPLDLTRVASNPDNVCLVGEHGCVLFIKHQVGIYEFHTSVLPAGRGKWMIRGSRFAFDWMFTKTDAFELLTKCPQGNLAASAGARAVGCSPLFGTRPLWLLNGNLVSIDIYSIIIQHWVVTAKNLEETGNLFHNALDKEYKDIGKDLVVHEDDSVHDRYVGATVKMLSFGQLNKAVNFYNRWAVMSGYKPISIVSYDPLIIDIQEAKLLIKDDNFEVIK